jgi:hypothetical protein
MRIMKAIGCWLAMSPGGKCCCSLSALEGCIKLCIMDSKQYRQCYLKVECCDIQFIGWFAAKTDSLV